MEKYKGEFKVNPSIFRAYDIRGNASKYVTPETAYRIGYVFAISYLKRGDIVFVGRDGRASGPALFESLSRGLSAGGVEIVSLGIAPTPLVYFAQKKYSPAASFVITASHNPAEDNGFKISLGGKAFFGESISGLLNKINSAEIKVFKEKFFVKELDLNQEYVDFITEGVKIDPALKILWDPGGGAACRVTKKIIESAPNENFIVNSEIDGNFSGRPSDPTVRKNLDKSIDVLLKEKCDFGIAFDGDGDRIGVITKKGELMGGDVLLSIFAAELLKTSPGSTIISDVKAGGVFTSTVEKFGGKAELWKTGNVFIKEKMEAEGAKLAGEASGHMFFADRYYGYDDGLYAGLRLIDLISRSGKNLDRLLSELPISFSSPEFRVKVGEDIKFGLVEKIKQEESKAAKGKITDIDGIRVDGGDGWYLLRASNTESSLVARCGSDRIENLEKLKSRLIYLLSKEGVAEKDLTEAFNQDYTKL